MADKSEALSKNDNPFQAYRYQSFEKKYRFIYRFLKKSGPIKAALLITGFSIFFSALLRYLISMILGSPLFPGIVIAVIIPAFLAPFLSYLVLHVFLQLYTTEEALRHSEERFRELTDLLPETIYETDTQWNFTYLNQNGFQNLQLTQEDLRQGVNALDIIVPEDRPKAMENFQRTLRGGKIGLVEHIVIGKDGKTFPALFNSTAILQKDHAKGLRGFLIDMTEKKKLQEQIQRAQKMEAVGTLAGGVAHDLNNILSGLVSYPDLLLIQIPAESPLRGPIQTIKSSGERAAALVQDLLTLARRGVSTTAIVNLNQVISDYLDGPEFHQLQKNHPDIRVETNLNNSLFNIKGSRVHLLKTVMNLISNAAEAMPEGGQICVSTVNRYVDAPFRGYDTVDEGDYVEVTVWDTGSGIAPQDIGNIFEPFYTKKVMGKSGTGLGLAVVWGTVKDHNGYIDVKSTPGKGTTFKLFFPATRHELETQTPSFPIDRYKGNEESILVVDDVKEQREIAYQILSELNYRVETVSSGEEALAYLRQNPVNLILLDMIMTPMNGLETYRKIVQFAPRQKAVIASGYSQTDDVIEAQRLGAGAYIQKPYSLETIGLTVKTELAK